MTDFTIINIARRNPGVTFINFINADKQGNAVGWVFIRYTRCDSDTVSRLYVTCHLMDGIWAGMKAMTP